jgi:exopolyphosphatase/guanosine-5'-triphosphate,3'-diphosphate pyrophosphatase
MQLLASVDIGSNAVRLLIGHVKDGSVDRVKFERSVTRLGEGSFGTGILRKPNMERTLNVLKRFSGIIASYGIKSKRAVGTEALRAAKNSKEFLRDVLSETGIEIEIISTDEEAGLTATGAISSIGRKGRAFILDIGGGSTEWMLVRDEILLKSGSIPLGVIRLHDKYIKNDPPAPGEIGPMKSEIRGFLDAVSREAEDFIGEDASFVQTGGTASTIASIDLMLDVYEHEKIHTHKITIERLGEILSFLEPLPLIERAKARGLEPERADLIIPGIHFTIMFMERFGFQTVTISDCGLPEGVILRLSGEGRTSD